ncbi:MAG: hypothetical protein FD137_1739 [Spirochaetes bacterium]|nr:MAG: hypothetical protein FD137_1739 [Spirochaetota bacterium]
MEKTLPFLMLFIRPLLFLVTQSLIAAVLAVIGDASPWVSASKYWITFPVLANIATIFVLKSLYEKKGIRYVSLFKFSKTGWWKDLLISIGVFAGASFLAMAPNVWLASLVFGSQETAASLLFNRIPLWAVAVALLWPVTQPFAELPLYFDYCMGEIKAISKNGIVSLLICSFALAFQHITLPLLFDAKYLLWRFGMFLFLAIYIGTSIKIRPKLLPYIVVGHGLLDLPVVLMFFTF